MESFRRRSLLFFWGVSGSSALLGACGAGASTPTLHGATTRRDDARLLDAPEHPPIAPLIVEYQYWQHHFIQWLPEDSRYETIELLLKEERDDKAPVLWLFLTEREAVNGSKRQVHLVSDAELARRLSKSRGEREIHVAAIEHSLTERADGTHLTVKAQAPQGHIAWQFDSQGPPSATHGGRLIDAPDAAHDLDGGLLVFFLGSSALSAKTSTINVGETTSGALQWPELSHPPHFTAYRGVHSSPAQIGYFPALKPINIELESAPSEPSRWRYRQEAEGIAPESVETRLIRQASEWRFTTNNLTQHTERTDAGFVTTKLSLIDGDGSLTLSFAPPIPDLRQSRTVPSESRWTLSMVNGPHLMSGRLTVRATGPTITIDLQPESPRWAASLPLETRIHLTTKGHQREATILRK